MRCEFCLYIASKKWTSLDPFIAVFFDIMIYPFLLFSVAFDFKCKSSCGKGIAILLAENF